MGYNKPTKLRKHQLGGNASFYIMQLVENY